MKMDPEIASFIWKFEYLSSLGRNADLHLSSKDGKVSVNLSLDIGVLESPFFKQFPANGHSTSNSSSSFENQSRNGLSNSQQRRLEKRAEERRKVAAEAMFNVSEEEQQLAEKAKDKSFNDNKGNVIVEKEASVSEDVFASNKTSIVNSERDKDTRTEAVNDVGSEADENDEDDTEAVKVICSDTVEAVSTVEESEDEETELESEVDMDELDSDSGSFPDSDYAEVNTPFLSEDTKLVILDRKVVEQEAIRNNDEELMKESNRLNKIIKNMIKKDKLQK